MAKHSKRKKASSQIEETTQAPSRSISYPSFFSFDKKTLLQALLLVLVGLWVFWPALNGSWLWDDDELIYNNPDLRSLTGLWNVWFTMPATDYWPLTWSVLWVEWHLWGNAFIGYHLCSLVLHLTSACLIWRILNRLGVDWGWVGGLLFVVHPLAVESVGWISEIKNTLSLPLFLLSFDAWINADENGKGRIRSILLYLAAVLCKTSVIMLPVVLLLYCWWKRGRITLREFQWTLPYFAIAAAMSFSTIYLHPHAPHSNINDSTTRDLLSRTACAGVAVFFYLWKFVLPLGLLPIYPRWEVSPPSPLQLLTIPLIAGLLLMFWTQRKSWGRHALFGFGFFLINVFPVLGFVDMAYMNITWVADHLVYLPMLGLIGLTVASLGWIHGQLPRPIRCYALGVVIAALVFLSWLSHSYAAIFIDSDTFWYYTLARNPKAYPGYINIGQSLMQKGRVPEALDQFQQAVQIQPNYPKAHCDLGVALFELGRIPEAIEQYKLALKFAPDLAEAHNNLGNALLQSGQISQAMEEFQAALHINPNYATAHNNFGNAFLQSGQAPLALEQYKLAVKADPTYAEGHNGLGVALEQLKQLPEAMNQYMLAVRLNPRYTKARDNLGRLFIIQGQIPEAIEQFQIVLRINPKDAYAQTHLTQLQGQQSH